MATTWVAVRLKWKRRRFSTSRAARCGFGDGQPFSSPRSTPAPCAAPPPPPLLFFVVVVTAVRFWFWFFQFRDDRSDGGRVDDWFIHRSGGPASSSYCPLPPPSNFEVAAEVRRRSGSDHGDRAC